MRIFYDCEFIENGSTIDLISIGMVREDDATFYAINNECDFSKACPWVYENVIQRLEAPAEFPGLWMPRSKIAEHVKDFVAPKGDKAEIWGYYSDYDHVALCQLFGRMIDLPKGFPWFTLDVKQLCLSVGDPALPPHAPSLPEHHALNDALWTRDAWTFLINQSPPLDDDLTELRHLVCATIPEIEARLRLSKECADRIFSTRASTSAADPNRG